MLSLHGVVAHAQHLVDLGQANGWRAYGGTADNGQKLCGMSTEGGGRYLGIKYFAGEQNLDIQLSKKTWKVKDGLHVKVQLQFDNQSPWEAEAESFHIEGDGALQFNIAGKDVKQFTHQLIGADTLFVRFPNERELEDWQADLAGTPKVVTAWAKCLQTMVGQGGDDGV